MPSLPIPPANTAQLHFAWFMPGKSTHSEMIGSDGCRVTAVAKVKGDAQTRRNAYATFLEWPFYTSIIGSGGGPINYTKRYLPLAYPSPFVNVDDGTPMMYANRFSDSEGIGDNGQETGLNVPLPLYQYVNLHVEFTDRSYDLLADSAVAAPGPIGNGAVPGNPATGTGPAVTAVKVFPDGNVQAGDYWYVITGITSDGETLPGTEAHVHVTLADQTSHCSILLTWPALAGAAGYKVYRGSAGAGLEDVQVGPTLSSDIVSFADNFLWPNFPAKPPKANSTASPLYDPAGGIGGVPVAYPDEGAALAMGNGSRGGRYITRDSEPGGRAIEVPAGYMQYVDTGYSTPTKWMKVEPTEHLYYTHHMVPRAGVPNLTILNAEGTLNGATFDGWPPGVLLFNGVKKRNYRSPMGQRVVDLQFEMTALPHITVDGVALGHNSILEFTGGPNAPGFFKNRTPKVDYSLINSDAHGGGNDPYRLSNFAALFRPDQ